MKRNQCPHAIRPVSSHGYDFLIHCPACNTWWRLYKTAHTEGDWTEYQQHCQRLTWIKLHTTYRNEYKHWKAVHA